VDCGEQHTSDGPRRVTVFGDHLLLQARHAGSADEAYRDVYEFCLDGLFAYDEMVAENAHASSAESDLATRLIVTRVLDDARSRVTLRNNVCQLLDAFRR
jgi:hypothetical protein